ncbi:uncharacterized protein G2W53_007589 [Senna tora]|uniref:Uncharacterized protein n=1 Tax=Senna tora TaxID=362788 RepID=A0A834X6J3_9FABA|nr:uncharacterized protein G2W53_007589 [Senna tora]
MTICSFPFLELLGMFAEPVGCGSVNQLSNISLSSSLSSSALTLATLLVLRTSCGVLVKIINEVWEHHPCPFLPRRATSLMKAKITSYNLTDFFWTRDKADVDLAVVTGVGFPSFHCNAQCFCNFSIGDKAIVFFPLRLYTSGMVGQTIVFPNRFRVYFSEKLVSKGEFVYPSIQLCLEVEILDKARFPSTHGCTNPNNSESSTCW